MIRIMQSAIPSKNAKVIRKAGRKDRWFVAKNDRALTSERSILFQLKDAKNIREWDRMSAPFDGSQGILKLPLFVKFKYFRPDHSRFDYMNATAILADCMVKACYLVDDSARYLLPVYAPYEIDAKDPRVEITIVS